MGCKTSMLTLEIHSENTRLIRNMEEIYCKTFRRWHLKELVHKTTTGPTGPTGPTENKTTETS
jgi:hypothetical protein